MIFELVSYGIKTSQHSAIPCKVPISEAHCTKANFIAVKRLGDVMNAPSEPMTLIPTRANVNQATNITVNSICNGLV